jgi:hypothetical protein
VGCGDRSPLVAARIASLTPCNAVPEGCALELRQTVKERSRAMVFKRALVIGGLATVLLSARWAVAPVRGEKAAETAAEEAVFELKEISATTADRPVTQGQRFSCTTEPDEEVKAYPKLRSKQPLYGKAVFGVDPISGKGSEFHFVLDESAESTPSEADEPQQTLLGKVAASLRTGTTSNTGKKREVKTSTYDRLYFDANGDLDLTNDPVLKPLKDFPWGAVHTYGDARTGFEHLEIKLDLGPDAGICPLRLLTWFTTYHLGNQKQSALYLLPAVARRGKIQIGTQQFNALLAQPPYSITGRFDRPSTALYLTPLDSPRVIGSYGFGRNTLSTIRSVEGDFYTFSATPLGDQLTVKHYRGDLGVLRLGTGSRNLSDDALDLQGTLVSENSTIEIGSRRLDISSTAQRSEAKVRECRIPVGDYLPSYLTIEYGQLRIGLSDNYHSEDHPRDIQRHRRYAIKIDKEKPFVLDFSTKPEVFFVSPAKEQISKPGDKIEVKAVLVDPVLDIMIRRLYDGPVALDPIVTITDASGKTIAEGKMPFG